LFVAIADGMAAVVGKKYGTKKQSYHVFNMYKTYAGSCAYYVFAYICLLVGLLLSGGSLQGQHWVYVFAALPPVTMLLEAVSPYGIDNIIVPIVVVLALNTLV
jgi:dolichol kinase